MTPAYTRRTQPKDIPLISANMREEDVEEVKAASGLSPREALLWSLLHAKPCMTICLADHTPAAMWGVTPVDEMMGKIWLLGTDDLVKDYPVRRWFLRESRDQIDGLLSFYPVLGNCVDARNKVHIRWLQWMGFTFIAEHPNYGTEGRPFLEFCKVSHV